MSSTQTSAFKETLQRMTPEEMRTCIVVDGVGVEPAVGEESFVLRHWQRQVQHDVHVITSVNLVARTKETDVLANRSI